MIGREALGSFDTTKKDDADAVKAAVADARAAAKAGAPEAARPGVFEMVLDYSTPRGVEKRGNGHYKAKKKFLNVARYIGMFPTVDAAEHAYLIAEKALDSFNMNEKDDADAVKAAVADAHAAARAGVKEKFSDLPTICKTAMLEQCVRAVELLQEKPETHLADALITGGEIKFLFPEGTAKPSARTLKTADGISLRNKMDTLLRILLRLPDGNAAREATRTSRAIANSPAAKRIIADGYFARLTGGSSAASDDNNVDVHLVMLGAGVSSDESVLVDVTNPFSLDDLKNTTLDSLVKEKLSSCCNGINVDDVGIESITSDSGKADLKPIFRQSLADIRSSMEDVDPLTIIACLDNDTEENDSDEHVNIEEMSDDDFHDTFVDKATADDILDLLNIK